MYVFFGDVVNIYFKWYDNVDGFLICCCGCVVDYCNIVCLLILLREFWLEIVYSYYKDVKW